MIAQTFPTDVDTLLAIPDVGRIAWGTADAGGTEVERFAQARGIDSGQVVANADPTDPPFTAGGGGYRMGGGSIPAPLDVNGATPAKLPALQLQYSDNTSSTTGSSDAAGQSGLNAGDDLLDGDAPRRTDILGSGRTGVSVDIPPAIARPYDLTLLRTETLSPFPANRPRGHTRSTENRTEAQTNAARQDDVTKRTPIVTANGAAAATSTLKSHWKVIAGVAAGAILVALLIAHTN